MKSSSNDRPGSGVTKRVWDIADQITRESGRQAQRKDVIDRSVAEGINLGTARAQFSRWNKAIPGETHETSSVDPVRLTLAADGRVVIPADMRRAMQLDHSGQIQARVVNGELRMLSPRSALAQARDLVRAFDTGEGSPVDELLQERRADSVRE